MRITIFCPSYGEVGGIETIATCLAREFRRAGHPVALFARENRAGEVAGRDQIVRVPFHQLPRRSSHVARRLRFLREFPAARRRLREAIAQQRSDVVLTLAVSTYAPYVTALARNVPTVVSLQGGEARGVFAIRPRALRRALRAAHRVAACARSLAREVSALAPEVSPRLHLVPNGVDPERFATAPPYAHPSPYVGAVGRLVPQKGFDVLLASLARASGSAAAVHLLLAGDGPERHHLEAHREQLGLRSRVHLVGAMDVDGVASLYRGALFVACPSRWEGLPVVCLEAMASGRALVASAVDGIPDAVVDGETGLLVPVADVDALAAAIERLTVDAALRERFGAAGRSRAREDFAWPHVAARYLTLLEEAADRRPPSP